MNKLKTVFQRTQKTSTEERRPQQFVKRHSSTSKTNTNIGLGASPLPNGVNKDPPAISLSDLSEMEKPAYLSWWKDLDPFDLQKINNETILKFLNGCSLSDSKLEQIVALFETAGDGLNKFQFFAMLRLIAHAQNGRKISPALVYLGAPIPHFHTNAIDVLIKPDASQKTPSTHSQETDLIEKDPSTISQRKSWWGNEKQQQTDNRRSYMGPFTAHTPIPNSPFHHQSNTAIMEYYYTLPPITNSDSNPVWTAATTNTIRPALTSSMTTTTITPVTPNIIQLEEKQHCSHSRSKSAGTAIDFNPYQHQQQDLDEEPGPLQSSRSSLSLHELNTGQSLLLTQKFVYQSPSLRNQEMTSSSNPFNISSTPPNPTTTASTNPTTITTISVTPPAAITTTNNNFRKESPIMSPFDDENHSDVMTTPTPSNFQIYNRNDKPNVHNIPPPPVPNQSTKPSFPKYTRTNTFLIKRSQSIAEDRKHHFNRHQRHKSTSATENIFY